MKSVMFYTIGEFITFVCVNENVNECWKIFINWIEYMIQLPEIHHSPQTEIQFTNEDTAVSSTNGRCQIIYTIIWRVRSLLLFYIFLCKNYYINAKYIFYCRYKIQNIDLETMKYIQSKHISGILTCVTKGIQIKFKWQKVNVSMYIISKK